MPHSFTLRVGLSHFNDGPLAAAVRKASAPILVSANALARKTYGAEAAQHPGSTAHALSDYKRAFPHLRGERLQKSFCLYVRRMTTRFSHFQSTPPLFQDLDVALDSAGFTAMTTYGDYLWTIPSYLHYANSHPFAWVAAMDFCVEPELARQRHQVQRRIALTARYWHETRALSRDLDMQVPIIPVLQGWTPEDYLRCSDLMVLPESGLVGLGSMCRRNVHGPNGILAVLQHLDQALPRDLTFHLFGVKSASLAHVVSAFPRRVTSADSQAWDFHASKCLYHAGLPKTQALRAHFLASWYERQLEVLEQPGRTQANIHTRPEARPPRSRLELILHEEREAFMDLVAEGEIDDVSEAWVWAGAATRWAGVD